MNLSSIFIMVIIGLGCTVGFMDFAIDLTAQYDVEGLPDELKDSAEDTMDNMNATTNTILEILSGKDNSWVQTSYNIFFALPVEMISTFANVATFGATFGNAAVTSIGASGGIPLPSWIFPTVLMVFIVSVVFGLWATMRM